MRRDSPQSVTIQVSDRVSGLLYRHKDVIQEALPSGLMPEVVRNELRELALTPVDVVVMLKDPSCRRALGRVLNIPQLEKEDLALKDLHRAFAKPCDPEAVQIIQACKILFSTPETSAVGAVLVKATLYPAFSQHDDHKSLGEVAGLMIRKIAAPLPGSESDTHPGFENWKRVAGKVLLWSYGTSPSGISLDDYMKAAQLGGRCFGSLEDPRDLHQAVRVLQEFIPKRSSDTDTLYSQPVPVRFRDGIGYEGLAVVLREFPIQKQLVPWMTEMLAQVKRGFQDCSNRCANYRQEQIEQPWQSEEYFEGKRDSVRKLFDDTVDAFANVCGFFAIAVDHECDRRATQVNSATKGRAEDAEDILRTALQDKLGRNVADTMRAFCAVISEPGFNFPCVGRLAGVLDELLNETLKLPLDMEAEASDRPYQASVYQGCMLKAFQDKVAAGDFESAVNIRRLFPVAGSIGFKRDTVDPHIDAHQTDMVSGVVAACHLLTARRASELVAQPVVDNFVRGLFYFLRAQLVNPKDRSLVSALSSVVRYLVTCNSNEEVVGITSYLGCRQAGLVFQRICENDELSRRVASEAFESRYSELLKTVARFIEVYNGENQEDGGASIVEALYSACSDFHDQLPSPKSRHLSNEEDMRVHIAAAFRKWQSSLDGSTPSDRLDLRRIVPLVAPADSPETSRKRFPSYGAQPDGRNDRDAHLLSTLEQWEAHLDEVGTSLIPEEYPLHVKYLLSEAKAILRVLDSADFSSGAFKATFAGLFAGLHRSWNELTESDRQDMADCASQMIRCNKNVLLCADSLICRQAGRLFAQVARPETTHTAVSGGDFRAHEAITKLLNYWDLGGVN